MNIVYSVLFAYCAVISCTEYKNASIITRNVLISNDSTFHFTCRNRLIEINLPQGFEVQTYQYEEGYFKIALFPDSSYVQFHCGSAVQLPFLKEDRYILTDFKETEQFKSRRGRIQNTNLFWREDRHKDYTVLYNNLTDLNKVRIDGVFDSLN